MIKKRKVWAAASPLFLINSIPAEIKIKSKEVSWMLKSCFIGNSNTLTSARIKKTKWTANKVAKYDQGVICFLELVFTIERIHFFNDQIQTNAHTK